MEEHCECDEWTLDKILDEIVSNLGSLQGIHGVRWHDNTQSEPSDRFVQITPWEGHGEVVRLAIQARFHACEKNSFDRMFTDG